ncbi:MAG: glycosyltransferase [Alistipes sp.]|nr:glycosyltransferase [Alistipes sp.]
MKKLSLIIATYNRSQSLLRTLSSVVAQSAPAQLWECVVVNNNSTDDTIDVFARFAAENQAFNLRMVTETEQGLSAARNCGIRASVGEIVAIVDDDETLESSYIESYIEFFDSFPTAMAAGGAVRAVYEGSRPRWMSHYTERMIANPLDLDVVVTLFPKNRVPAGGNMAFRREVFERVGLFNPRLGRNGQSLIGGEENDLFARLRAAGELLYFVPNAAIYHHIPQSKLTDDYFDRLSYNVGRSKRLRAEADDNLQALLADERRKRVVTYILALLYLLTFQLSKAQYLIRMRKGISRGIESM